MADTPKKPQPGPAPGNPQSPRRRAAHKLAEEQRQRLVVMITGATLGVALLVVMIGLVYDQLWTPSRPVASVGATTLSRSDYWEERRVAYARDIVQNFQLLVLLAGNPEFTQQFQGQSPFINRQIPALRRAELDEDFLAQWEAQQLIRQGAAAAGVTVAQDEVVQALTADLEALFLPDTTAQEVVPEVPAPEADDAAAAAEVEPTATPTPRPTLLPAVANERFELIIDEIYRRFEIELAAIGDRANLSRADFRDALIAQYQEQLLVERLQADLVPEEGFAFSEEPTRVRARQVLVAVEVAEGGDADAAFSAARPQAEEVLAALRAGADFATVAAEESDDLGSREQGGDLSYFDLQGQAQNGATYPPELVAVAFALPEGTLSEPVRTLFGWHILEVTEREVPPRESQLREERRASFDAWLEEQRVTLQVQRFPQPTPTNTPLPVVEQPTLVPTYMPGPPTPFPFEEMPEP